MRRIKRWLLELSISYIKKQTKDSGYIRHAIAEFDATWSDWREDNMQNLVCNQVLELLSVLSLHRDTNNTIGYKLNMFKKVAMFDTLGELTFTDADFIKGRIGDSDQHKRLSTIFRKPNGVITYLDGLSKEVVYRIGEVNIVEPHNGGRWTGRFFVLKRDRSVYQVKASPIVIPEKFTKKKCIVPTYNVEYPQDWHISLVKEEDIQEVEKHYKLDKVYDGASWMGEITMNGKASKEVSKEILKRVDTVYNHMYNKN